MKTSAGNRTFDTLILAIGIIVAVIAGLKSTSDKDLIEQTSDTPIIVKSSLSDGDTANNENTCQYLESRLKIN